MSSIYTARTDIGVLDSVTDSLLQYTDIDLVVSKVTQFLSIYQLTCKVVHLCTDILYLDKTTEIVNCDVMEYFLHKQVETEERQMTQLLNSE